MMRCKSSSGCSDSGSITTSVHQTTPKRTMRSRASQIPVRTDRLHPATINHDDDRPRRHSSYGIDNHDTTTSVMLDLSRRQEVDEKSTSGRQKSVLSPGPFRRRSLTDNQQAAHSKVLARLAKTGLPPEAEMTSLAVSRRPHKLDPISLRNNDQHCLDANSTGNMATTSTDVDFDDVTSGVRGGGVGDVNRQDGRCRVRPLVSRKAKALMMM